MEENKEFIEIEKVDNNINKEIQENKTNNVENTENQKDKKGMALAGMILGIVTIVLCFIFYISIPCGILAIIFGAMSLKSTNRGMALAGVITGIVGIILTIVIFAVIAFSAISIFNQVIDSNYYDDIYDDMYDDTYDKENGVLPDLF